MLCDSHCHLDSFSDAGAAVANAKSAGVERMLSNSTSLDSIAKNISLPRQYREVKCALGIHPVDLLSMGAAQVEDAFGLIERNISSASAIGEVGLDFKRATAPDQRALQETIFRRFISLAKQNDLPIVVHTRWAETQCLSILEQMKAQRVHLHWFTNSAKNAARAVSLGYRISCGPIIISDAPSATVVKGVPLENLMLETDAPVEFAGKRSEPSWIPRVCGKVAELKGLSSNEVALATTRNFRELFG